jgi:putative colanic acid biosynthesis acetyltransferase WcaF
VHIDRKVILDCTGTITIGEATRISPFAHLCAVTYDYTSVQMPVVTAPITIGRDVWIANDAFVGPGVTVGDGAVLAARSSAFSDLPTGQVCMGEPARPRHPRQ